MEAIKNFLDYNNSDSSILIELIAGILICLVIYFILIIIKYSQNIYKNISNDTPVIFSGLVDASKSNVIHQNPNIDGHKTLLRSINENGIEFSYSLWLWIDPDTWVTSLGENTKNWKHVFHKGTKIGKTVKIAEGEPHTQVTMQCPGLWLAPLVSSSSSKSVSANTIRYYVNTFDNNKEYIEISNIPVKRWVHVVFTQSNKTGSIFINGRLKKIKEFSSIPRQNYYDLYTCENGGYKGYLSKFEYFNFKLSPTKIYDITVKGPNLKMEQIYNKSSNQHELTSNLPYLSNRWWVENYN